MKRILLVITFGLFALASKTQTVFNGKYGDTVAVDKEPLVKLIYFFGSMSDNKLTLRWNVADNKSVNLFEVQKSYDGKNFITAGLLFSSEKDGNETYFFPEILTGQEKIFYCLKMIDNHQRVKYSKVLSFQPAPVEKNYFASIKYPVIIK